MNNKRLLEVLQATFWKWHLEDRAANTYAALADGIGKSYKTTYNYFNPNEDGDGPVTIPPVNVVAVICNFTGNYDLIQFLCNECSGFFTQKPAVNPQDELSIFQQLDNIHEKNIRLSQTLREAWTDGKITLDELNGIIKAAIDNQAASQEVVEWAQEMRKGGSGGII